MTVTGAPAIGDAFESDEAHYRHHRLLEQGLVGGEDPEAPNGVGADSYEQTGDVLVAEGPGLPVRFGVGDPWTVFATNEAGTTRENIDVNKLPQTIDTTQVESFTFSAAQTGLWVPLDADDADPRTITLPADGDVDWPIGRTTTVCQEDALAEWTIAPGAGVTIRPEEGRSGNPRLTGQGAVAFVTKLAANTYRVTGQTVIDDFLAAISETGVWTDSGANTGDLDGGKFTSSQFTAEQTYTADQYPLPAASGGTLGQYFRATGTVTLDFVGTTPTIGPRQATQPFGPGGVFHNEITQVVHENQGPYGHGPVGFMDLMMTKNVAGETRTLTPGYSVIAARLIAADGGDVTLERTDVNDGLTGFVDNNLIVTAGSGSVTATDGGDYSLTSFISAPGAVGDVTLSRRIGFLVKDIDYIAGTGIILDGVPAIGGRLTNTVDDSAPSVAEQYGVMIPRLVGATTNVGIRCDSTVKLWGDTVDIDDATTTTPRNLIETEGTWTLGGSSDLPPRLLNAASTIVVDATLNALAGITLGVRVATILKSEANGTARDLKGHRAFVDNTTVRADTSADTLPDFGSFVSGPTFGILNAGTLAVTDAQQFYAVGPSVGSGVTITTLRGLRITNASGAGTVTNQIGLDIASLTKGATLNIGIRNASRTVFTPSTQALAAVGDTITPTATVHAVTVAAGGLTMTSAPTIADGADGQILTLINVDSADTVTIQDQGTLASSNLRLVGTNCALAPRESITLMYSSTVGDWVELHRSGNVT